jgi:hypothetical protein
MHNTFFDVCITRDVISASVASDVDRDRVLEIFDFLCSARDGIFILFFYFRFLVSPNRERQYCFVFLLHLNIYIYIYIIRVCVRARVREGAVKKKRGVNGENSTIEKKRVEVM